MPIRKFLRQKALFEKKITGVNSLRNLDWSLFWMSDNANKIMSQVCITVEQEVNLHAPSKSCFVRNDKPKVFLDKNKFLSGKKFKSKNEASLLKDFIALKAEKSRWKFIQEVTNKEKQRTVVDTVGKSFVEFITNRKDIANLLNFKFSVLGEYFSEKKSLIKYCS